VGTGSAPVVDGLRERTAELGAIERAVADAVAGDGRLLVFEGPAGIGKSSLLQAARDRAEAADMEVLSARGGELERRFGFGVARQLFEGAVRDGRSARRLFAGSARLAAPVLGVELGPDSPPALRDPGEAGFAVQHGLYWLTAQLTERRPVALVVDDAHWADPESLRFLVHLARRLEGLPVLLAVATRPPSDGDRLLHQLAATPGAEGLARRRWARRRAARSSARLRRKRMTRSAGSATTGRAATRSTSASWRAGCVPRASSADTRPPPGSRAGARSA
jgi:hypothetical protein